MCLIVDVNAFSCVFDKENKDHNKFEPIFEWIIHGKGKIIIGGAKYNKELRALSKYLRFLAAMNRAGKVVRLKDNCVDAEEARVRGLEADPDFDDPHLIAMVLVSGCRIVCTKDRRAIRFLKDRKFYSSVSLRPKVYQDKRQNGLIGNHSIVDICKPCNALNKAERSSLGC